MIKQAIFLRNVELNSATGSKVLRHKLSFTNPGYATSTLDVRQGTRRKGTSCGTISKQTFCSTRQSESDCRGVSPFVVGTVRLCVKSFVFMPVTLAVLNMGSISRMRRMIALCVFVSMGKR
ncbi:uncharacterized protein EKO05_0010018 [Ascochyta rabiei]|uniref:uncharacterized protein n=1 Tax=Didymella rabiei TaxID=5454 RepID=UPI0021FEEA08|nr:uncharacterized protein EKO05_0010018 [Ascochyta rabiei]UPX19767.1 hypothetical protein EKO05_0010018 [Ascochyta rabiei]